MYSNKLSIIFALAFVAICNAEILGDGPCPSFQVKPDFNIEKYMGFWYEYARNPVILQQGDICSAALYSLQANGTVDMNNTMIYQKTGDFNYVDGFAELTENAKLEVTLLDHDFNIHYDYWILDTDYSSYSSVYFCLPLKVLKKHFVYNWIYTRKQFPSENTIAKAKNAFIRNGISVDYMQLTNQVDCN